MIIPTRAEFERIASAALKKVADEATNILRSNIRSGLDADGKPMAPYSPKYAELRKRNGKSTTVNLTVSGQLLDSLKVLRADGPDKFVIGFDGGRHRPAPLTLGGRPRKRRGGGGKSVQMADIIRGLSAKRDFLGIRNPADLQRLRDVYERELAAGMRALG